MKLSKKLIGGFSAVTTLTVLIAAVGYYGVYKVDAVSNEVIDNRMPSCIGLLEMKEAETAQQRTERSWILSGSLNPEDKTQMSYNLGRIAMQQANYDHGYKLYEPLPKTADEKLLWDKYLVQHKAKAAAFTKLIELCKQEKFKDAYLNTVGEGRTAYMALEKELTELVELNEKYAATAAKEQDRVAAECKIVLLAFTLGSFGLAALLAWLITRNVTKQLGGDPAEVQEILAEISRGCFSRTFIKPTPDSVLYSVAEMVQSLRQLINQVNSISHNIASASTELQSTAEQIATGAEEVSCQSGTVATSSEEMSATAQEIAQNCLSAAQGSDEAAKLTRAGFEVVVQTVTGIKSRGDKTKADASLVASLGKRSEEIGNIIGTIEDIADQTNLLALNAAIEAARAGEQGRGFAVVADEVRALAERTTRATKEIASMIKGIQEETNKVIVSMDAGVLGTIEGAKQAATLETSLTEVTAKIESVMSQVSQIATAAEEQTAVTHEVSTNIQQISEVVHMTAKGADDTAKAAANLAEQAHYLQEALRKFTV